MAQRLISRESSPHAVGFNRRGMLPSIHVSRRESIPPVPANRNPNVLEENQD